MAILAFGNTALGCKACALALAPRATGRCPNSNSQPGVGRCKMPRPSRALGGAGVELTSGRVYPWALAVWRSMDGVNGATPARVEFRVQTSQVHFTRPVQEKQRSVENQRNRVLTPPSGIMTSGVLEDYYYKSQEQNTEASF
uniref:Uncharacterized protein n=1 Tax=Oryza punctata TaxID=4537 RepID=A0A0E0JIG1_ORYPU